MSIRDIIEKWHLISTNYARHGYTAAVHGRDFEEMRDDFASALEELSLMEAVCEAAADVADEVTNGVPLDDNVIEFMDEDSDYLFIEKSLIRKLDDALDSRAAYRKERGL